MKIQKNIEANGFRLNFVLETNDRLSHKLLSENQEFAESLSDILYDLILMSLTNEKTKRNL